MAESPQIYDEVYNSARKEWACGPLRRMRFPWANSLLLALIVAELLSGFLGLISGSPDKAIFILSHRVAGYGILVVLAWKCVNVALSLKWPRSGAPRTASLALTAVLIAALALGFSWSVVGPYSFWLFSGVSWHIYAGVALVPVLVWHSVYHTRGFPPTFWADRRSFLRLAGIVVLGAAVWQLAELGARFGRLGGAERRFTGSTRPKASPATTSR